MLVMESKWAHHLKGQLNNLAFYYMHCTTVTVTRSGCQLPPLAATWSPGRTPCGAGPPRVVAGRRISWFRSQVSTAPY